MINKISVALVVLAFFILFGYSLKTRQDYNQLIFKVDSIEFELANKHNQLKELIDLFTSREKVKLLLESANLNPNDSLQDENNNRITLRQLVNHTPMVVFRIMESNCSICIERELELIGELIKKIGQKNIIIISSYSEFRELNVFKSKNKLNNLKLFNTSLSNSTLGFPIEEITTPFFFIIDESFKVKSLFIPEKTIPEFSIQYYDFIHEKYFKNKI